MKKQSRIAILLTCHNRREKTKHCLKSIFAATFRDDFKIDIFLVDDGSTDNTTEMVIENYPEVHVINGTGSLFWNQGMRLAWQTAINVHDYDFYIWLNDDTLIKKHGFLEIFECFYETRLKDKKDAIIVGGCHISEGRYEFSYGGRNDHGPVIPDSTIKRCKYINGNIVLVPQSIYNEIGILSDDYTHAMGDFDYGLRAIEAGYHCYTTRIYVGECEKNERIPNWSNPEFPLIQRWKSLHSPTGLNIKEYKLFRRRFWGAKWSIYILSAYFKTLFPSLFLFLETRK